MLFKLFQQSVKETSTYLVVLSCLSLFLARDYLRPGLPVSHDGLAHVARLAAFSQSFSEGNLVPRWGAGLNAGYGHPVLMFLYPLTNYLGTVFYLLGFSLANSVKLVFLLTFLTAGIGIYLWLRVLIPEAKQWSALLGAGLYQLIPYRGVDLFVRGALGELAAFAVAPLVGLAMIKLVRTGSSKWFLASALGVALLILAHNALSLLLIGTILGLVLVEIWFKESDRGLSLSLVAGSLVFGLGLTAFFWFPAFFEGKYTLRDLVTGVGSISERFPSLRELVAFPWVGTQDPDFSPSLGGANLALAVLAMGAVLISRRHRKSWWFLLWLMGVTLVSFALLQPVSLPVWERVTILQKFQFPWRLLAISALTVPIMAALCQYLLDRAWSNGLLVVLAIAALGLAMPLYQTSGFKTYSDDYFDTEYLGTTDTGESSPRWSIRGIETRALVPVEVIAGRAKLGLGERKTTRHRFSVSAETEARIKDNTLYFPGWQVLVDNQPVVIEFQDPNHRGMITFNVPEGGHQVLVKFGETKLRLLANLVSLVSWVLFVTLVLVARVQFVTDRLAAYLPRDQFKKT